MTTEWKLVPVEMTDSMFAASCRHAAVSPENWSAMLAAAPQPPALGAQPLKLYDISGFGDGMVERDDGAFVYADDHRAHVGPLLAELHNERLATADNFELTQKLDASNKALRAERDTLKARMEVAIGLLRNGLNRGSPGWDLCVNELLHPGQKIIPQNQAAPAAKDGEK